MNDRFVYINYDTSFSQLQLEEIKNVFEGFEIVTEKRGHRVGAIDIITVIEISLGFGLAQYFGGLISKAGEATWDAISKQINNFLIKNGKTKDVTAFIFYADEIPIYVIERFHDEHADHSIKSIPIALLKVDRFFRKFGIPEGTKLMQIFQHPITKEWKYLFVPTTRSFGSFIDRVVNLDTFELYEPENHLDFITRFCGNCQGNHCLVCAKYHLFHRS